MFSDFEKHNIIHKNWMFTAIRLSNYNIKDLPVYITKWLGKFFQVMKRCVAIFYMIYVWQSGGKKGNFNIVKKQ